MSPEKLMKDHLSKLIDSKGINHHGYINGTSYKIVDESYFEDGSRLVIKKADECIIELNTFPNLFFTRKVLTAYNKAKADHELFRTRQRIQHDTEKYLSRNANTKEAFDDLKTIKDCTATIESITDKWRKRNVSLSNI